MSPSPHHTSPPDGRARLLDPLAALPLRPAGSIRRAESVTVYAVGDWDGALRIEGRVEDSLAAGPAEPPRLLDAADLVAELDAASKLTRLSGDITSELAGALVGLSPVSGFRGKLSDLGGLLTVPSPLAALLDELPTVRLISGYARLIESPPVRVEGRTSAPVLNVCRGWASDGTAAALARAGRSVITSTPPAPSVTELTADSGWLREPPSRPSSMRRRRLLDVSVHDDTLTVYEYFRDSHLDRDGTEGSLHEYVVTVAVDRRTHEIRSITAEPRALPFAECPLAAANVALLVGTRVDDVEQTVRSELGGTMGCTHLSDVLRFLRYVGPLAATLDAERM